jgi:integrase
MFEAPTMARRRSQRKGHLFERSGYWLLRYRVDTPELDAAGKRIRERITVTVAPAKGPDAIGKREAQRVAWEEYLSKLDQFSMRPSSMRTLREFYEQRFQPDVVATLKPAGKIFYRAIVGKHILPAMGETKLRDISPAQIQGLVNSKIQAGLSVQTATHVRNCISAILRHAKAMQWFAGELPTAAVRLPPMKRKVRRAMTWDQVCTIANALPEPVSTLAVLLTLTGLRIGEAMGLRWRWMNLTDDFRIVDGELIPPLSIAVRENFVLNGYQTLKSEKSTRNIAIPAWFVPRLLRHLLAAKWNGPQDPVFAASHGRPLDQHNLAKRVLKPVAIDLKMPWLSWHVFRHTWATLAGQSGFSVTEMQRVLGHASDAMTMHYAKSDLDLLRPRLEAMVDPKKLIN